METIRGRAKAEGKHKKQSGGRGQYGHVWLEVSAADPDSEERLVFVDDISVELYLATTSRQLRRASGDSR